MYKLCSHRLCSDKLFYWIIATNELPQSCAHAVVHFNLKSPWAVSKDNEPLSATFSESQVLVLLHVQFVYYYGQLPVYYWVLHAHFSLYETAPVTIQIWPLHPYGQLNLKGTVQRDLREIINSTNQQQNFF